MKKVTIGITDCEKYHNYEQWMLAESDVEVIRLSQEFSNLEAAERCDGILITGGEDVHPKFYNSKEIHYPNAPKEFVENRDEFEIKILAAAKKNKLPVLGVCRGLQLINCASGGTLKQDLGELNKIHRRISKQDKIHPVKIIGNTRLKEIAKIEAGDVNSSHHQAIDKLAAALKVNCVALDGTVEGIEGSVDDHQFLLAVQWHPERMLDQNNPLSKNIKDAFLERARRPKS